MDALATNPFLALSSRLDQIDSKLESLIVQQTKVRHSYSKREFSKIIGKSMSWIDSRRRDGSLSWIRIGGSVMIPHSQLEKFS